MSTSTAMFTIFVCFTFTLGICTYKILKRAKILHSVWDLAYERKEFYKKMKSINWDVSDFPTINPNDLMLRFVTFSQKRKYYIFFAAVILINTF